MPARVVIPSIGVDAPVVPVGVDRFTHQTEVPDDVDVVGWYRFGPTPGAPGSSLLLGHVDSRVQGLGAFFRLGEVQPGALITVRYAASDAGRHQASFVVVARRSYPKVDLPGRIFARGGRPVLALVTCGGAFNEATRHYADNVVVYAVPRAARTG